MTLGWVALGYGAGALLAFAVACCGPARLPKIVGAYLVVSWLISNKVFSHDLVAVMIDFSYLDIVAIGTLGITLCVLPSRWLSAVLGALTLQILLHLALISDPDHAHGWTNLLLNNLLFAVQVTAVAVPALSSARPRRRRPAAAARRGARRAADATAATAPRPNR